MGFEWVIIVLIVVAVWILGTVFAKSEEPPRRRPPLRPPGDGPRSAPRTSADLERFLEEARRRREAAASRPVQTAPPVVVPAPRPVAPPQPPRPSRSPDRQPPRPRQPVAQPAARRESPRVGIPVAKAVRPSVSVRDEDIVVAEVVETFAQSAAVEKAAARSGKPARVTRPPESPVATQVLAILKTPRSAAAAFVLREIFDPPLCNRRAPR